MKTGIYALELVSGSRIESLGIVGKLLSVYQYSSLSFLLSIVSSHAYHVY